MSTTAEELSKFDARLRSILDAESAPIIGPCLESIRGLSPELLQDRKLTTIRKLLGAGDDSVRRLVSCLSQWPTITVLILTERISEAYGEENEYAVHDAIAELLGQKKTIPLTNTERKLVWREFRRACYRLGLTINSRESGVGYMVDEFLHQAGLPLSFVPKVTQLMLKTAVEVGMPDEDDLVGIARWQECLLEKMTYLPPTAKKSIEADKTGFYARTFLRACNSSNAPRGNSVAGIMAEVVEQSRRDGFVPGRVHKILRIPRLLWLSDELVVELPPSDEDWTISVDGEEQTFRGSAVAEVVPILSALPQKVEVRGSHFTQCQTLWEDKADNRFLIFDSDGRWVRSASLGQPAIEVPPGEFILVLRFEPEGISELAYLASPDPDLYVVSITLLPGQKTVINRGPAQIVIETEIRPWITFGGNSLKTLAGERIWQTGGSRLDIAVGELMETEEAGPRQYIVRFSTGGVELGKAVPQNGSVSLEKASEKLPPGLHRIVAELCPEGTQRGIARTAGLVWKGLHRRDNAGRLCCTEWPRNLLEMGCENVTFDKAKKEVGPRDFTKRTFQLEFQSARNRTILLEWIVPGIFMQLEDYASTQVEHIPISLGMTLAVPSTSRQVLRIRSSKDGQILLQERLFKAIKANHPVSLHVSSLAETLEAGRGDLEFSDDDGDVRLLQLTAPHQIHSLAVTRTPYQCQYRMRFASRCTHVQLRAENMLSDESAELTISCDDPAGWSDTTKARLESDGSDTGLFSYCLTFESRNWNSGAWLVSFDVRIGDRWGSPSNLRQDQICCGLLVGADGTTAATLQFMESAFSKPITGKSQLARFTRVHQALQRCYAPECWQAVSWSKELWKRWLRAYAITDGSSLVDLIGCCAIQPPEGSSKTWLPMQRIESSLPELFARPVSEYVDVRASDGVLASALRAMASFDRPPLQFPEQIFCAHLACGFGLQKMIAGERPGDFDFDEYCRALLSHPLLSYSVASWQPSLGEYLGRDHYQIAWERLRSRYRETLGGNEIRRQFTIRLCLRIRKETPVAAVLLQSRGRGADPDAVEARFLEAIEVFVSSFARACRNDVRQKGTLAAYREQLTQMLPPHSCSMNDVLSYVLQLAPDLFAFYLLLWEIIFVCKLEAEVTENV